MFNTSSLSLDQAPPISIPFRFFLTAPLFGMAAGLLLLWIGPALFLTRWSPMTLGLTHLLTLGFLAMVMCGALLQMLPVLAGSPVPRVVGVGTLCHLLITLGTGLLVLSFLSSSPHVEIVALSLLGVAVLLFYVAVTIALWRVKKTSYTVVAMRLAVLSLLITMLFGLLLGSGILSTMGFSHIASLVDVHLGWGILGWIGLLLIGISYQVVPMFQVTPEYPLWVRKWLAPVMFLGMIIWSGLMLAAMTESTDYTWPTLWMIVLLAGFVLYAFATLQLQRQRKRRIPDVTMQFWRVGMIAVVFCAGLWIVGNLFPEVGNDPRYNLLLGVGLVLGAGVSVINGMLYKIVPFLSWFHLQNRQLSLMCMTVKVPHMKEFVSDKSARLQFNAYLISLFLALATALYPQWLSYLTGVIFLVSNLLLLKNLSIAMFRYRSTNLALRAFAESSG